MLAGMDFAPSPATTTRGHWLPESAGAGVVLALSVLVLYMLVSTINAGTGKVGGRGISAAAPPSNAVVSAWPSPPGSLMLIVTVGEVRGQELRLLLDKELELRTALGEPAREAAVVIAVDAAEAEVLQGVINEQANIAGVAPMAAVIVR
jgi:hypothetical protein